MSLKLDIANYLLDNHQDKLNPKHKYHKLFSVAFDFIFMDYTEWFKWASWEKDVLENLSDDFINKFKDNFLWNPMLGHVKLSEDFIERHQDKMMWWMIFRYQKLSMEFLERHIQHLNDNNDWRTISYKQELTEEFMEKYINNLDMFQITLYQKLSIAFIVKHLDASYMNLIRENENIKLSDSDLLFLKLRGVI